MATSSHSADGEAVHSRRQLRSSPLYASPTVAANQLRPVCLAVTVTCEVTPGGVGGGGGGRGINGAGGEGGSDEGEHMPQVSGHRSRT